MQVTTKADVNLSTVRRRKSTSRSRTGCMTCRRKRVKCDERKPTCLCCWGKGIICGGYNRPSTAGRAIILSQTPRVLLPRASRSTTPLGFRISDPSLSSIDVESRYLRHFQERASSGFDGMMDWPLWNVLVLQLSRQESFVRDFLVAIGGLSKALEIEYPDGREIDNDRLDMARLHRQYALLKYGQAVKSTQIILGSGYTLRRVLIASLLVYCFEVLLHNRNLALSHITSGHHLLRDWLKEKGKSRMSLSPDRFTVDDEVVEAFDCMDLQISTIFDSRRVEIHKMRILEGLSVVKQMPSVFRDLIEAREYLLVVMRRCHHFLASTWPVSGASTLYRDFQLSSPLNGVVTTGTNIYSTSVRITPEMRLQQKEFAEDLSRWSRAFDSSYQASRRVDSAGLQAHVVGALLRIHAISTEVVVAAVLFTEEMSYDSFLPLFYEMYQLATIVVEAYRRKTGQSSSGFFLDLGITSPLYLLVARCRDHSLRVKAIHLLKGWHSEACWQPRLIAAIGEFVMEVEEEGRDADGFIPEQSRAIITACCDAPQQKCEYEALIQVVQRHGGPRGKGQWHERRVYY